MLATLAGPALGVERPDLARVEDLIVERTNAFRRAEGLPKVTPHPRLQAAAREFAYYMAQTERYGHEADGRRPSQRAKGNGYDWCRVTENISYQYSSSDFSTADLARRYFEGWKESPGHRANMVDAMVSDTAVAVVRSGKNGYYYAVQMFGQTSRNVCDRRLRSTAR